MKKKILIVDDENIILHSLRLELEEAGYDIAIASSGEQGLSFLRENYFNLVITDLMMEGIGGLGLLQEVKEIDPDIAVIILTGFGEVASAIEALRLGAADYLLKPCDSNELQIRIEKCLEEQELAGTIKLYESILPICDVCKKVCQKGKDGDQGQWKEIDQFISERSGQGISHGYCPDCYQKALAEIEEMKNRPKGQPNFLPSLLSAE